MHLVFKIGERVKTVSFDSAQVFFANHVFLPKNGEYLVIACGTKWADRSAMIRLKSGNVLSEARGCIVSYAGNFARGDKVSVEGVNVVAIQLMLFEVK